jgi:hypothetical protein
MSSIWSKVDRVGWKLLSRAGYPDEAALHTLVELTPQLLPLAGSPRLAVVGREVRLGSGSADLIGVEPSGRLVVIEVKLATNAESRRAVVAQVLAYASHLHGMDQQHFEGEVLRRHLHDRGFDDLYGAIAGAEELADGFGRRDFYRGVSDSLAEGRFRLVIVLDEAPEDLVRLVGYLEHVTDRLVIDLVTVASYDVNGQQIAIPTRVEPERWRADRALAREPSTTDTAEAPGIDVFRNALGRAPADRRPFLEQLCTWATELEARRLARLVTFTGTVGMILRVYIPDDMSLATVNYSPTAASVQLFRSVFTRRAPDALPRVEEIAGVPIGNGTAIRELREGFLDAVTAAYQQASTGQLTV